MDSLGCDGLPIVTTPDSVKHEWDKRSILLVVRRPELSVCPIEGPSSGWRPERIDKPACDDAHLARAGQCGEPNLAPLIRHSMILARGSARIIADRL